ncbi:hypothetical protein X975_18885, partial [Stegodyphus mimosarum]
MYGIALAKGYSTFVMAKTIGCDQSTVSRSIKLLRETDDIGRRVGSRRKKVIITSDDQYLKRMSLCNHNASTADLKVEFKKDCAVNLRARLVHRRFAECNTHAYHPKKMPLFKKQKMQKRLSWTKEHVSWAKIRGIQ